MKKETIKISAPGKLMLFGEHAVVYNRPCIVTAVDQRIVVAVQPIENLVLEINAPDVGIKGYQKKICSLSVDDNVPKGARFLETAVKSFFAKYNTQFGIKVNTQAGFSSEFGFGSSSAVTVGVLKALAEITGKKITNQELFDLSYQTIQEVQKTGSGFDLAAAIWGGTIYFKTGGEAIESLEVRKLPFVVGYTGVKADTPTLIRQVADLRKRDKRRIENIFDQIASLAEEAKQALMTRDWKRAGRLMNLNQELLEKLKVSTSKLMILIEAAREAGAYGAKLSGAGGGDCMIALVPERKKKEVEEAITKAGGTVLKVKTNAGGVRLE